MNVVAVSLRDLTEPSRFHHGVSLHYESVLLLSSVRLITEQIQLVAKSDITGFVGQARKSPENGHFLEKRE